MISNCGVCPEGQHLDHCPVHGGDRAEQPRDKVVEAVRAIIEIEQHQQE